MQCSVFLRAKRICLKECVLFVSRRLKQILALLFLLKRWMGLLLPGSYWENSGPF